MMRIAIVVNRFPTLSETFIFSKVKGLVKQGFDVTVVTHGSSHDANAYAEDLKEVKVVRRVKAFQKRDIFFPRLYLKIVGNLLRSLAFIKDYIKHARPRKDLARNYLLWLGVSDRYDIIHFEYTGLAITYLDVLEFLKPSALFTSCRGAAEQIRPLADKKRAMDLVRLFTVIDRVHCVSNDMLDTCVNLYGLSSEKAFVNRPAIDTYKFKRTGARRSTDSSAFVICSTGRLHWKKGYEYALLSMHKLRELGYSYRYEIIGSGPEIEKLKFMVHDLKLQDHVVFHGSLTSYQVKERLESCDMYLLPSLSEGISNAVLEAMAMELPVIATRAGGMEEVITHNISGLLVDAYDVAQMTNSLIRLMKDEGLRDYVSSNGRVVVQSEYTIQRQIKVFVEQYERSTDGKA